MEFVHCKPDGRLPGHKKTPHARGLNWLRGQDLNLGPSGYEPDELPGCSTPRLATSNMSNTRSQRKKFRPKSGTEPLNPDPTTNFNPASCGAFDVGDT